MRFKHLIPVFLFLLIYACVKDKPTTVQITEPSKGSQHRVLVVNEGNYGVGNAALSLYNPLDQSVVDDYYHYQNNVGIGDVLQSLIVFKGKYYLVVNNSSKVVICDSNMKKLGQINNLLSPRYLLPIVDGKAYVSDIYANQIHVVDLQNMVKVKRIPCGGWTEKMLLINAEAFVCNLSKKYLYVINVNSDVLIDSIAVAPNAAGLAQDKNGLLWLLCSGDNAKSILPSLYVINPQSHAVIRQLGFSLNDSPSHLCINAGRDSIYYINKGIFQLPITSMTLPAIPLIAANNRNFYGLNVGAADNRIYLSDALDYVQKSTCYVYSIKGELLSTFKAGINANAFYIE